MTVSNAKLLLGLLLISKLSIASTWASYPCLELINRSTENLQVQNNPNWDDQLLLIDGKTILHDLQHSLTINQKISICGFWYQFGLNLYPYGNFISLSIANNDATKLTHLSNISNLDLFNYTILEQSTSQLKVAVY